MKLDKKKPHCKYCGGWAILQTGEDIYPNRPDLAHVHAWICTRCDARVGCHPGTITPHGHLANAETRQYRIKAHSVFDKRWKNGSMSRTTAYKWLAKEMKLSTRACHIGSFDTEKCKRVIELSTFKR